jgi:hypothetical protein
MSESGVSLSEIALTVGLNGKDSTAPVRSRNVIVWSVPSSGVTSAALPKKAAANPFSGGINAALSEAKVKKVNFTPKLPKMSATMTVE